MVLCSFPPLEAAAGFAASVVGFFGSPRFGAFAFQSVSPPTGWAFIAPELVGLPSCRVAKTSLQVFAIVISASLGVASCGGSGGEVPSSSRPTFAMLMGLHI